MVVKGGSRGGDGGPRDARPLSPIKWTHNVLKNSKRCKKETEESFREVFSNLDKCCLVEYCFLYFEKVRFL